MSAGAQRRSMGVLARGGRALGSLVRSPATGRLRTPWRILAAFGLWVVATTSLLVAVESLLDPPASLPALGVGLLVLGPVAVGPPARYLDRRPVADLGLHLDRAWWRDFGAGVAIGLAVPVAVLAVSVPAGLATVAGTAWAPPAGTALADPLVVVLLVPLVQLAGVAVAEELLFRGYLVTNLAEGIGGWLPERRAVVGAWLLSAATFALWHAGSVDAPFQWLHFLVAGLLLGLPFVLTGELGASVGLHLGFDYGVNRLVGFEAGRPAVVTLAEQGPPVLVGDASLVQAALLLAATGPVVAWLRWRDGAVGLRRQIVRPPAGARAGTRE